MKCVLLGGSGFIGRRLGRLALDQGHEVVALDVDPSPATAPEFPVHACDAMIDPVEMPDGVDAVYYLAQSPRYRVFPEDAWHLFGVNVVGALRAAEAAQRAGARFFCYASSGTVYRGGFEPMREDRPVRDDDGYALSKTCAESALALLPDTMSILCVRLFGVFGPGQAGMLVPNVIERVRARRAVTLDPHPADPNDGDGFRISLTFVDDVARCLLDLAAKSLAGSRIDPVLNVAGDEPVSVRRLAEVIGATLGVEPVFEVTDKPRVSDYVADIGRLRALLDPRFTPLDEALARTLPSHG